ncbi:hypothetical protein V5O48_009620 [Marasmius crinis-equi]|uniref:F-box domain-containing protein n=1 Tax=Marasmius crinis-equi TaxID=585013 RepID=A0ABR3FAM1_9AGAR
MSDNTVMDDMSVDAAKREGSSFNLSVEVHQMILSYLTPKDLLSYSLVDTVAHKTVKGFYGTALQAERILAPYFSPGDTRRFRILQYATGTVISGSTALSFFTREVYDGSDLDLYVDVEFALHLVHFLASCGYAYEPYNTESKQQPDAIEDAIEEMSNRLAGTFESGVVDGDTEYMRFTNGIGDVFNFVLEGRRIQVIACHLSPVDVVLKFHSTVVMNIITYSHAISFYPCSTFRDKVSLRTINSDFRREQQLAACDKYALRGWSLISEPDIPSFFSPSSAINCREDPRHPGDRHCWTVPLRRVTDFEPSVPGPGLFALSSSYFWKMTHHMNRSGIVATRIKIWPPYSETDYFLEQALLHCQVKTNEREHALAAGEIHTGESAWEREEWMNQRIIEYMERKCDKSHFSSPYDSVRSLVDARILREFEVAMRRWSSEEGYHLPDIYGYMYLQTLLCKLYKAFKIEPDITFVYASDTRKSVWTNVHVTLPRTLHDGVDLFLRDNECTLNEMRRYSNRVNVQIELV